MACNFSNVIKRNFSKTVHPFKKILAKKEAVSLLANNLLYKDDSIAVFNKPAGMAKSLPTNLSSHQVNYAPVYLETILHDIVQQLPDFKELHLAKFPDRYTSGVMILASSKKAMDRVSKCKRRILASKDFHETYLAITTNKPIVKEQECKFAIRLAEKKGSNRSVPILEDKWSNSDWKMNKVKIVRCKHSVVSGDKQASLTRLSVSRTASNAVRLYFATKLLSPIFGDHIFSARVKDVMGVAMLVDPWSDAANTAKKLPPKILKSLNLTPNDTNIVPLCLHLEEFRLPGYFKDGDLVLRAPPPPVFQWTCQQLGLSLPDNPKNEEIPYIENDQSSLQESQDPSFSIALDQFPHSITRSFAQENYYNS